MGEKNSFEVIKIPDLSFELKNYTISIPTLKCKVHISLTYIFIRARVRGYTYKMNAANALRVLVQDFIPQGNINTVFYLK